MSRAAPPSAPEFQKLVRFRHQLHACPEPAGAEAATAEIITRFLQGCAPTSLHTGLGGHGVLATFSGREEGPTVLLRCELDALPAEPAAADEAPAAQPPAAVHTCGHDGHMAMLSGVAAALAMSPLERGRVALLFQPSEENGAGAARVLQEPVLRSLHPTAAFALHNVPGFPLGAVLLREGPITPASAGLTVRLSGRRAHAGEPETGVSPALAFAQLIEGLCALPDLDTAFLEPALVTIVGARLGQRAFGTAPGEAEVYATLRALRPETYALLRGRAEEMAKGLAAANGLRCRLELDDEFPATANDAACVRVAQRAAEDAGLPVHWLPSPFPWSEDFGALGALCPLGLLGLGSGLEQPALHHPDYVFPDALVPRGARLLTRIVSRMMVPGDPTP